ncbi:MAG: hypothetical protein WA741_31460 [Candidatus Sulfotelmatobacter sp.]
MAAAVVLMGTVPAGGDPQTIPDQGCLGETFNVTVERHAHINTKINEMSLYSPTGTPEFYNYDLSIRGTYVRELRAGKLQWVSRTIDWSGQYSAEILGCYSLAREAGGHLELGPTDGGVDTISPAERGKMIWNIKPGKGLGGSCFLFAIGGSDPVQLPSPWPRATGDQLRYAHGAAQTEGYYSKVERDGTRYSEWVEAKGSEKLNISAEHTEIDPNQPGKGSASNWVPTDPDEPGSQLTITATCDGAPLKDRQIGVRIDAEPRSGHHNHLGNNILGTEYPRPRGELSVENVEADCGKSDRDILGSVARPADSDNTPCITVKTDADGKAKVKFKSPLTGIVDHPRNGSGNYMSGIAGTYRITATDVQTTAEPASTEILVKVRDLERAKFGTKLTGTGATSEHPDNFYGRGATLSKFKEFAEKFYDYQDKHNKALTGQYCSKKTWDIAKLSLNDIALKDGGIFDLMEKHPAWGPPHYTHSIGGGGDFNRFTDSGLKTGIECGGTTANLQIWYLQVMVELGKDYGKWDCKDLGASSGTFITEQGCQDGDIPTGEGFYSIPPGFAGPPAAYVPPLLHLHVED